jgi:ATP-dependent Clp protease ATP-binding subunit ClpC
MIRVYITDLIIEIELKKLFGRVEELGYKLNLSDTAKAFIAEKGFDKQFGARPLKRVLQKKVLNELSKQILSGEIKKENTIIVDAIDNQIVFR